MTVPWHGAGTAGAPSTSASSDLDSTDLSIVSEFDRGGSAEVSPRKISKSAIDDEATALGRRVPRGLGGHADLANDS